MIGIPFHLLLRLGVLFRYLETPEILNQLFASNLSKLSNAAIQRSSKKRTSVITTEYVVRQWTVRVVSCTYFFSKM